MPDGSFGKGAGRWRGWEGGGWSRVERRGGRVGGRARVVATVMIVLIRLSGDMGEIKPSDGVGGKELEACSAETDDRRGQEFACERDERLN